MNFESFKAEFTAKGAAAERERIMKVVEKLNLINPHGEHYDGFIRCRNIVLSLLKDGDGE